MQGLDLSKVPSANTSPPSHPHPTALQTAAPEEQGSRKSWWTCESADIRVSQRQPCSGFFCLKTLHTEDGSDRSLVLSSYFPLNLKHCQSSRIVDHCVDSSTAFLPYSRKSWVLRLMAVVYFLRLFSSTLIITQITLTADPEGLSEPKGRPQASRQALKTLPWVLSSPPPPIDGPLNFTRFPHWLHWHRRDSLLSHPPIVLTLHICVLPLLLFTSCLFLD